MAHADLNILGFKEVIGNIISFLTLPLNLDFIYLALNKASPSHAK